MFNNPALSRILLLYALYPFFMFLSQLFYNIMIGIQKPKKAAVFVFFSVISDVILILGTAIATKNLNFIILGLVASVFLQWLYARISIKKISYGFGLFLFDRELLRNQLKFSLPIGIAAIIGVISAQIDKLVISSYFTPEIFAVFSVGATELPFLGIIINSVNAVILPEMSKQNNLYKICELYKGAVRKNALLILPIFAFCMVFAAQIIEILYSDKYLGAVVFFRIYLLTMPLRIATYGLMFQVSNKTRFIFMISVLTLFLNSSLSILLIKIIGVMGPAIAAVSVTFATVLVYLYLIRHELHIDLFSLFPLKAIGKTLASAVISAMLCYWILLLDLPYYVEFIIGTILFIATYLVIGSLLKAILPYDRQLLKDTITTGFNKIRKAANV